MENTYNDKDPFGLRKAASATTDNGGDDPFGLRAASKKKEPSSNASKLGSLFGQALVSETPSTLKNKIPVTPYDKEHDVIKNNLSEFNKRLKGETIYRQTPEGWKWDTVDFADQDLDKRNTLGDDQFEVGDIVKDNNARLSPTGYRQLQKIGDKYVWSHVEKPFLDEKTLPNFEVKAAKTKTDVVTLKQHFEKGDKAQKSFVASVGATDNNGLVADYLYKNKKVADELSNLVKEHPDQLTTEDGKFNLLRDAIAKTYRMEENPFGDGKINEDEFVYNMKAANAFDKKTATQDEAKRLAEYFSRPDVADALNLTMLQGKGETEMNSAYSLFPKYRERINETEERRNSESDSISSLRSLAGGVLDFVEGLAYVGAKVAPNQIPSEQLNMLHDKYKMWKNAKFTTPERKGGGFGNELANITDMALTQLPQMFATAKLAKVTRLLEGLPIGASAYADGVNSALSQGYGNAAANIKGLTDAATEVMSERLFNDARMFKTFQPSKGLIALGLKENFSDKFKTQLAKEASSFVGKMFKSREIPEEIAKQVSEEYLSNYAKPLENKVYNYITGSKFDESLPTIAQNLRTAGSIALITAGLKTASAKSSQAGIKQYGEELVKRAAAGEIELAKGVFNALRNDPDFNFETIAPLEKEIMEMAGEPIPERQPKIETENIAAAPIEELVPPDVPQETTPSAEESSTPTPIGEEVGENDVPSSSNVASSVASHTSGVGNSVGNGSVDNPLIYTEENADNVLSSAKKKTGEDGFAFIKLYDEQKIPINIGIQTANPDKGVAANNPIEFKNSTTKEIETAVNVGDEVVFRTSNNKSNIGSKGAYKLDNLTTGKSYAIQWFSNAETPSEAIKEIEKKILGGEKDIYDADKKDFDDDFKPNQGTTPERSVATEDAQGTEPTPQNKKNEPEANSTANEGGVTENGQEGTGQPDTGLPIDNRTGGENAGNQGNGAPPSGEGDGVGIRHVDTAETRKEVGLPEYEKRTPKEDATLQAEADAVIKKGYDPNPLLEKLEKGIAPNELETVIIKKYKASLEAQFEKDPSEENFAKIERLVKASDAIGSIQGAAFRQRQGMEFKDDSLAAFFITEKELNKDAPLTEDQKETVKKEWQDIDEAKKKYDDYVAKKEEDLAKREAALKVQEAKKTTKKSATKDYAKERQDIKNSIKEKWQKAANDNTLTIVPLPYAKQLYAVAPDVAKLMRNYVGDGISKLEDLVTTIHKDLKENNSEISERDVLDIIAGKYNEKTKTRNKLSQEVFDLREQAKLVNKYEALINGEIPKNEKSKIKRNQEIEALRKKIKDFEQLKKDAENEIKEAEKAAIKAKRDAEIEEEKFIKEFEKEKESERKRIAKVNVQKAKDAAKKLAERTPDEVALDTYKKRTQSQINKLEKDISSGNFAPPEKKEPIKLDAEGQALQDKLIKLKQQREVRILTQQYQNRSGFDRARDKTIEVLNIPRTIMASMDYSAPLRQAVIATIAYPSIAKEAAVKMFKASISQKEFDRWFFELKESPRYETKVKSKLALTDPHSPFLTAKEEAFMNNMAEKIPIAGEAIKGSERAYVIYLNKMRSDIFDRYADEYEAKGRTYDNSPELYDGLAKYVNDITGRGNMGSLERYAPILNTMFFSPRLISSRINLLTNLANPRFYAKVPPEVRKMYFKDMAKFVGLGLMTLALFKLGGADVEDDPRSADFGKIKVGKTRWDIWGGFQPYARAVTQMVTGERKSTNTGNIQKLDGKAAFGSDRSDVAKVFLRGKLAPVPAMAVNFLSGRTQTGEAVTAKQQASQMFVPLLFTGVREAMQDQGLKAMFTVGVPSVFGIGTQTYQPKPPSNKTPKHNRRQTPKRNIRKTSSS